MARKRTTEELGEIDEGVLKSITLRIDELFRKHAQAIASVRDDSDDNKVTVSFTVLVDCAGDPPKVKTRIRYSQSVVDELIDSLEDPTQPTLFEPEEGKAPKRGRRTGDDELEPPAESD